MVLPIFYPFLKIEQFFSQYILVLTEIVGIFFHSVVEGFVVVDGFVDCLFVLAEIFLVYLTKIIKITIDTFIGLFVFEFDIIEKFVVSSYLFIDLFEVGLYLFYFASDGFTLCLFHIN